MRRVALLLGGGFAVAAVATRLDFGGSSAGLRGLIVVLPIVAALFALLGHELGAPPPGPSERWLGALWLTLALVSSSLGLAGAERLVAGGFLLLLARRGAALLPALRRWSARPSAPVWPFVLLPFVIGLACLPWTHAAAPPAGDEPYFLLLSESLATDADVDLADEYQSGVARSFTAQPTAPQPFDPVGPRGEQYSRHGALLPLLLAPFWKAGGAFGARLAMVAVWAFLAGRLHRLLLLAGVAPRGALRAWGIATFAVPLLPYSRTIWIEVPAALAATLALEAWLAVRTSPGRVPWRRVALVATALAALPLLKLRLLAVAGPLALAVAREWPRRDRRRWVVVGAVAAVALALLAANLLRLDNPLGAREPQELYLHLASPGHYLVAGAGLFLDVAFGLLPFAPIWLLALPGAFLLWRRAPCWRWAWAAALPYVVLVLRRSEWYGGWCPPFRYLVVLTPWLAVALGVALERPLPRAGRRLAALLLAASAAIAWAVTFEPGWAVSLADGRSNLLDLLAAPFAVDFARFAPSAVRPNRALAVAVLVTLSLAVLFVRGRRRGTRALFPVAASSLLAGAALVVVAAHILPTRVAEAEDPWIVHSGGSLYPARWTFDRTRYDGGWILPPGGRLALTPRPGGGTAEVALRWRTLTRPPGEGVLTCAVDGQVVQRWQVQPDADWRVERVGGVVWRPGARVELRFRAVGPHPAAPVVIDRLEFAWQ